MMSGVLIGYDGRVSQLIANVGQCDGLITLIIIRQSIKCACGPLNCRRNTVKERVLSLKTFSNIVV